MPSLIMLSYANMKYLLKSKNVITYLESESIEKMIGTAQMANVLDIIQISLSNKQTTKFKGFLEAMEESDDDLLKQEAKKLGELATIAIYVNSKKYI